jgi:hypothetical protein
MSSRLLLAVFMICACGRTKRTSDAPPPPHTPASAPAPTISGPTPLPELSAAPMPSAASSARAGLMRSTVATGYTSGLRLESDLLMYCDDRGGRALDLASGVDRAHEHPCAPGELRNLTCDGIEVVAQVRAPGGIHDIIDLETGPSQPMQGRIQDCAFNSGVLLVATGFEVVAIDVKADRRDVKLKDGGNQVAISQAWMAWSDAKKVFAQRR